MESLVVVLIALAVYFLPAFVAKGRKKQNAGAIFVLNLLLGWTIIGWVIALIWAITVDSPTSVGPPVSRITGSQADSENGPPSEPHLPCISCGAQLSSDAKFCPQCGNPR
ncbi:MAG: superinfection immunity protein [Dehalococcoidia bacterium]